MTKVTLAISKIKDSVNTRVKMKRILDKLRQQPPVAVSPEQQQRSYDILEMIRARNNQGPQGE